jgi:HPt (histidine-containing phosphotransfer) domain-containing protein
MRAAFAADLPRRRAELDQALRDGDRAACAMVLHGLRGSAAHLGEEALNQLCMELEAAADGGDLAALQAALPRLARLLDQFEAACA